MPTTTPPRVDGQRMTLAEYLAGPPDEFKAELIHGVYHVCPSPTIEHQDRQFNVVFLLKRWTVAHRLGRVVHDLDMILDDIKGLVYRPDVLFLAQEHEARIRDGRVYGPAELAVEILSPSDKPRRRERKFASYERYGVAWYWVIDPVNVTLEENQLVSDEYLLRSEVGGDEVFEPGLFPGLQFKLGPLLAGDFKAAVQGQAASLV